MQTHHYQSFGGSARYPYVSFEFILLLNIFDGRSKNLVGYQMNEFIFSTKVSGSIWVRYKKKTFSGLFGLRPIFFKRDSNLINHRGTSINRLFTVFIQTLHDLGMFGKYFANSFEIASIRKR